MAQADFLSFLVDETLRLQKSGESELSSYELKLNDYGLCFLKGGFIPQYQVLRFSTSFGVLDVPVNWSIFKVDSSSMEDHILSRENDDDHLMKIFKSAWMPSMEKLLVTHADGFCYIVGLKPGDDIHLHDLLNPQIILKAC
jgi:hypothetical protein